jgi:hypothetical protein
MYFRTKKNNFDIDMVVATESDNLLVNNDNNTWLESDDALCVEGNYWHNSKFYEPGSDDYNNDIGPLISAARVDSDAAKIAAEQALKDKIKAEQDAMDATPDDSDAAANLEGAVDTSLEERKRLAKTFPKPVYVPIRELPEVPEITTDSLAHWEEVLADTKRLIAGVKADVNDDPDIVEFPEPITFLDGTPEEHTLSEIVLPDEDKASYLAHMETVEADQTAWVAHMKTVLGV